MFLDLDGGGAGSFPGNMAVVNNTLYFSAATTAGSSALWQTNGTVAGTRAVAGFASQPDADALFQNIPDAFAVDGNTMVFAATDGTSQTELWKTDGTAAGTAMIAVLSPSSFGYPPSDFTTVNGKVFFVTQVPTDALWVTDGTTAGTTEVATFDGTIADPTGFDGKLAFIESTPDGTDSSLWLSDGTASGTTEVMSFPSRTRATARKRPRWRPSTASSSSRPLVVPGPDVSGFDTLWVSDGTTAGTMPIAGAPVTANVDTLAAYQGQLYFSAVSPLDTTPRARSGSRMAWPPGHVWSRMWAPPLRRSATSSPPARISTSSPSTRAPAAMCPSASTN